MLLKHGANPSEMLQAAFAKDRRRDGPHIELVQMILDHGADPSEDGVLETAVARVVSPSYLRPQDWLKKNRKSGHWKILSFCLSREAPGARSPRDGDGSALQG